MTTKKVAVAIIHGIGTQHANFANPTIALLKSLCRPVMGDDLVVRPVFWADLLNEKARDLLCRVAEGNRLRLRVARGFVLDLLGDSYAYQLVNDQRTIYDGIHAILATALHQLAEEAGKDAPLCIIAHSLGSIIASNYLYDLQVETSERPILSAMVRTRLSPNPLELGHTLTLLYTLGSPLALFSLRFPDFGKPIQFPPPQLSRFHPTLKPEWINFYDADDVIGFPIKTLNDHYRGVVTADCEINTGSYIVNWNPLSHLAYLRDRRVLKPIADSICRVWRDVNGRAF